MTYHSVHSRMRLVLYICSDLVGPRYQEGESTVVSKKQMLFRTTSSILRKNMENGKCRYDLSAAKTIQSAEEIEYSDLP